MNSSRPGAWTMSSTGQKMIRKAELRPRHSIGTTAQPDRRMRSKIPVEKCRGAPRNGHGVVLVPDSPSKWVLTKPPDRSRPRIFRAHPRSRVQTDSPMIARKKFKRRGARTRRPSCPHQSPRENWSRTVRIGYPMVARCRLATRVAQKWTVSRITPLPADLPRSRCSRPWISLQCNFLGKDGQLIIRSSNMRTAEFASIWPAICGI